ncbi:dual specificity protein phosphatase 22-like [Mercenaria mercenaria]|uniref:dual specificity protein phosphatase 22-like n=1 Tax=Mercenaria mercenaria TaxID=6596 RepID=UPI00234E420C|nr:dual specificity protein phosphatase 22-like [Mercenaria mercenaria]
MGNGMNKIITGVYVGNFRDAKDPVQLADNKITHILSIHDNAKALHEDKKYLCIIASDTPDQPLTHHFPQCIDFIHKARLEGGRVLIHCLAGVSRSVTVTAAYIMTVTGLGWRDTVNAIRGARSCANPNFGFQKQLQDFENEGLEAARKTLKKKYPNNEFEDEKECSALLKCYNHFLMTGETRNQDLYSLPHRAYKERNKRDLKPDTAENFGKIESEKQSSDSKSEEEKEDNGSQCDSEQSVSCENNTKSELT